MEAGEVQAAWRHQCHHLHLLAAEALWQADGTVVPVAPPSDEDVARILARVLRQAKKDWADLKSAWPEDDSQQLQQRAIQERLGFVEAPAPVEHPEDPRRKRGAEGSRDYPALAESSDGC